VDKPAGPTSHDVVARARQACGTRRVGHAGTLDPFATGLLAVLVGRATRLARYLGGLDKTYLGTLRLGSATTTDDLTGEPLGPPADGTAVPDAVLREAMGALTGRYRQQPPVYSAKKVRGRPAHRRVRRGEQVTLPPQWVEVHQFEPTGREGADVHFTASVGSGVYLRALARDLGARLGCGAHLTALRRTAIGPLSVAEAMPLDQLAPGHVALRPARDAVRHLAAFELDADGCAAIRQGRVVPATAGARPEPVALVSGDELVAIAELASDGFHPRVVFDQ
jgi:tRNA pseudouridine55 synthase